MKIISMVNTKQLSLPNVSEAFMKTADVLLVLDDGLAILCHSQMLSLHSAVLCNMLADLAASDQDSPTGLYRGAVLGCTRVPLQPQCVRRRTRFQDP